MTERRKMDERTGLPLLPPTQFWRVVEDAAEYGTMNALQLRTRAPRWYNRNRSVLVVWTQIDYLSPDGIREAAFEILNELEIRGDEAKLFGDYPPKRLDA